MLEVKNIKVYDLEEKWKESQFKGYYISTLGRVKNSKGKLLSIRKCQSNGYNYVNLYSKGKNVCAKISRMVAIAFIPNKENKSDVDHINTIRTDDRLENLRWCTRKENMANPITKKRINSRPFKRVPKRNVPILQFDKNGSFIKEWESITSFCESINNISACGNIIACIKNKQKTAYGYKWRYKYEH